MIQIMFQSESSSENHDIGMNSPAHPVEQLNRERMDFRWSFGRHDLAVYHGPFQTAS